MSKSRIIYFCFLIVFLILIIWRYQVIELRIKNNELRKYNDSGKEVTLIGTVVKEPDIREKSIKLTIETRFPFGNRVSSKILATVSRYPEYKYGDELKITGQLQAPPVFEDFNYRDYLKKDGIYSVINFPKIELLSRGRASAIYAKILVFKNKLRENIYQELSFPQSSILAGMILGDKANIPRDLKDKLNITGLSHIIAISGMNIAILIAILMPLLLGLGLWRSQAFYFSIILISFYIILIGLQASAVRAGIMGGFFLLGQKLGRKSVSSRAIVIAAVIMLVINPLLLFYDIGFQLSFLATLGLIYLAPFFQNLLRFIPQEKFINLREILSLTLAAQIFTLPILIYNFGRISLVAPLTNILILSIVSLLMIFGVLLALLGVIWQPLAWLLSFPCWFLLTYFLKIVDLFSKPSWAAINFENVHWFWLIISYMILGFLTWRLTKRQKLKFLNY